MGTQTLNGYCDSTSASDTVSHYTLSDKLKATYVNPYVINWILDFLSQRKQKVVVDGITTEIIERRPWPHHVLPSS